MNKEEGFLSCMILSCASDGNFEKVEASTLLTISSRFPIFKKLSKPLSLIIEEVKARVSNDKTEDYILEDISVSLNKKDREVALVFASIMIFIDGTINEKEKFFLTKLSSILEIDDDRFNTLTYPFAICYEENNIMDVLS
jgi:hypothetical protein